MGSRGPAPKRSEERRRRNETGTVVVDLKELISQEVEIPVADEDWHPAALAWYESLARSGQAVFYEPSDWATAYLLAEAIDRELKPKEVKVGDYGDGSGGKTYVFEEKILPITGASLSAILKGMTDLMVTEAARRRAALELERTRGPQTDSGEPATVTDIREGLLG